MRSTPMPKLQVSEMIYLVKVGHMEIEDMYVAIDQKVFIPDFQTKIDFTGCGGKKMDHSSVSVISK